jgi:hypothetical protein
MRVRDYGEHASGSNRCSECRWKHHTALDVQVAVHETGDSELVGAIEMLAAGSRVLIGCENSCHQTITDGYVCTVDLLCKNVDHANTGDEKIRRLGATRSYDCTPMPFEAWPKHAEFLLL